MKKLLVSTPNALLLGGLSQYLKEEPRFIVCSEPYAKQIVNACLVEQPDVLLAEVRHYSPHTMDEWLGRCGIIREMLPACKLAFIVDGNISPAAAEAVKKAKGAKLIDAFFYEAAVTVEYLVAVIDSL